MTTKRRTTFVLGQISLADALNDPAPLSFDPPARPPLTARITCRVCERKEEVPILSSGLLCSLCRADLDKTELHIAATLASSEQRLYDAWGRWEAGWGQAQENDQARYQNVLEARVSLPAAEFARKYEKAKAKDDGLSALLRSKERCDAVVPEVERVRAWARTAQDEVEAAKEQSNAK